MMKERKQLRILAAVKQPWVCGGQVRRSPHCLLQQGVQHGFSQRRSDNAEK